MAKVNVFDSASLLPTSMGSDVVFHHWCSVPFFSRILPNSAEFCHNCIWSSFTYGLLYTNCVNLYELSMLLPTLCCSIHHKILIQKGLDLKLKFFWQNSAEFCRSNYMRKSNFIWDCVLTNFESVCNVYYQNVNGGFSILWQFCPQFWWQMGRIINFKPDWL